MGHAHLHHQHQRHDLADNVVQLPDSQIPDIGNQVKRAETFVRTVYKTMSPTFTGPIGGWSTEGQDSPRQTEEAASPADSLSQTPASQPTPAATRDPDSTTDTIPKSITSTSMDAASIGSALAVDSPKSTATHETQQSSYSALPSPTASSVVTPTSKSSADESTSSGAKAGIAFGVLGGVLLVSLIVFVVFNRRKRQVQRLSADNEKLNGAGDTFGRMPSYSDPRAPRISLRPVTQFLPNWNMDKNAQRGAANLAPAAANQWDRPGTSQSNHPNNPFGSGAERINSPDGPSRDPWTANGPAVGAAAGAAGAAAGTAAALARNTSMRRANQKDVDLTVPGALDVVPPSPAGTEFSTSSIPAGALNPPSQSAAAIAAAGGPPSSAVHRVQLDFKPTLEDEMELTAGDLVRLLHEYDDGWALCIRLDRSQQGVVPRTCLSTRPVKPRAPQGAPRPGPPINPQGGYPQGGYPQGGYPQGGYPRAPSQPGRPMTPQGRPMTPQGRNMIPQGPRLQQGMGPRSAGPMSPGRPQSPGHRYQGPPPGHSQSPSGINPMGPPGPGPMNTALASPSQAPQRKPVPGQAY